MYVVLDCFWAIKGNSYRPLFHGNDKLLGAWEITYRIAVTVAKRPYHTYLYM